MISTRKTAANTVQDGAVIVGAIPGSNVTWAAGPLRHSLSAPIPPAAGFTINTTTGLVTVADPSKISFPAADRLMPIR